jgi:hypothetical protein
MCSHTKIKNIERDTILFFKVDFLENFHTRFMLFFIIM